MASGYEIVKILTSVVGMIGVCVNVCVVYFISRSVNNKATACVYFILLPLCRNKRLRQLSVGGLILLCAVNDVIFNAQMSGIMFEVVRSMYNTTTTYQLCFMEKMLNFYIVPSTKASLFVLSLDRLLAVSTPVRYRVRNHTRFACWMAVIVTIMSISWWVYAVLATRSTNDVMVLPCTAPNLFPVDASIHMLGASIMIDMALYTSNAMLIYKVAQGSRVPTAGKLSSTEQAALRREAAITRSVRTAVFIHFVFNTIPFTLLAVALGGMEAGHISDRVVNMIGITATLLNIFESIGNAYVYVQRLPYFKQIVFGKPNIIADQSQKTTKLPN